MPSMPPGQARDLRDLPRRRIDGARRAIVIGWLAENSGATQLDVTVGPDLAMADLLIDGVVIDAIVQIRLDRSGRALRAAAATLVAAVHRVYARRDALTEHLRRLTRPASE